MFRYLELSTVRKFMLYIYNHAPIYCHVLNHGI